MGFLPITVVNKKEKPSCEVIIKSRKGQRRALGLKITYLKGFRKGAEMMRESMVERMRREEIKSKLNAWVCLICNKCRRMEGK